jgi:hypothetical protein
VRSRRMVWSGPAGRTALNVGWSLDVLPDRAAEASPTPAEHRHHVGDGRLKRNGPYRVCRWWIHTHTMLESGSWRSGAARLGLTHHPGLEYNRSPDSPCFRLRLYSVPTQPWSANV